MKKPRKYANYREWPDKQRKELDVVEDWLEFIKSNNTNIYHSPRIGPNPNVAPDCVISDQKNNHIAVEVTELVCEKAIAENQRGNDVYRYWQPSEVIKEISAILQNKDKKKYYGGPYSKIIILIHTDEMAITYNQYNEILATTSFDTLHHVTEAYLLLSYYARLKMYPCIKIKFKRV